MRPNNGGKHQVSPRHSSPGWLILPFPAGSPLPGWLILPFPADSLFPAADLNPGRSSAQAPPTSHSLLPMFIFLLLCWLKSSLATKPWKTKK